MNAMTTAAQVKELRTITGAGMMECKKALDATHGNIELAVEELRKTSKTKAGKKAGRIAGDGIILILRDEKNNAAVMLEINCETDFVARDENFLQFANAVAKTALQAKTQNLTQLASLLLTDHSGATVEEACQALIAKIGENIHIRRIVFMQSTNHHTIGTYLHGNRIGVMLEMESDNKELIKDMAMHIAASKPVVVSPKEVPSELIEKEKEIYMAQAAESGKPQDILEKMVAGKLKKFLDEISLVGQPFVKDPEMMVSTLLDKNRAKVISFTRFEVGEGIEKITENFVDAVMAQVHGA